MKWFFIQWLLLIPGFAFLQVLLWEWHNQTTASMFYSAVFCVALYYYEQSCRYHRKLDNIRFRLEEIVVTEGDDTGIFLIDPDTTCHYDPRLKCMVYDNPYFSDLGEALVELHAMASDRPPTTEVRPPR